MNFRKHSNAWCDRMREFRIQQWLINSTTNASRSPGKHPIILMPRPKVASKITRDMS